MKRTIQCPIDGNRYHLSFCQERKEAGHRPCFDCVSLLQALKGARRWSSASEHVVVSDFPENRPPA